MQQDNLEKFCMYKFLLFSLYKKNYDKILQSLQNCSNNDHTIMVKLNLRLDRDFSQVQEMHSICN